MPDRSRRKTVVLLSMGYDSLGVWHRLGRPPAVHFDLHTRYSAAERARYERLRDAHDQLLPVQDLAWLGGRERDDAWIPLRNLVLAVHAAALGFDDIVLAAPSDWAPDKRLLFTLGASATMRIAQPGIRYRVRRPFSHWTKARLVRSTPAELLTTYAYSCYEGCEPVCGRCPACGRALIAHLAAGRTPPFDPPIGLSFRELMDQRRGATDRTRLAEAVRMRPGELVCLPARALELACAWRGYRSHGRR